jgi:predicted DNA-binding transcriptional regulator YafY
MSTSGRLLRLLSLLQTPRDWTGAELADRLEVSPRTIRNDVERLRALGYPVHATRGSIGGYRLEAGASLPPLLLEDDEAVAVAIGLRTATSGTVTGIEETSLRALAKLEQVLPPRLRRQVGTLQRMTVSVTRRRHGPTVDPTMLTELARLSREHFTVRFDYSDRRQAASQRRVEPYRIVNAGQRWYLVAWDLDRADWRIFRLDRLTGPAATGARFRPRDLPAADAAAYIAERLGSRPTRYDITVLLHAPAGTVDPVVAVTGGRVEPVDDHSCRLRLQVNAFDWPVLILAAVGAEFDVINPPEFRHYLRDVGRLFLRGGTA